MTALQTISDNQAFCDWLDITMSPEEDLVLVQLSRFLVCSGGVITSHEDGTEVISFGTGSIHLTKKSSYLRASVSGGALERLRTDSLLHDYLGIMSTYSPKITRLDAAMDLPIDGAKVLSSLKRKHSSGQIYLSHKPLKTKTIEAVRSDGQSTGTFYAGHRSKARISARVYDKAFEILERTGVEVPPRTRYEMIFKSLAGLGFDDVINPTKLFWTYAAPALLRRPSGMDTWEPSEIETWTYERPEITDYQALANQVEFSPELAAMKARAKSLGVHGGDILLRMIAKNIAADLEITLIETK